MGKQRKKCRLCGIEKSKENYRYQEGQRGRVSYCMNCEKQYEGYRFIYNKTGQVTRALTQAQADRELLKGSILFQHQQYVEHTSSVSEEGIYVLAVGRYDEKRYRLDKKLAQQYVDEQAGVWEGDVFRHLFARKELQHFVVQRDGGCCYFCQGSGTKMTFLRSRSKGGLLSPVNSVCCCDECKEEHGEDMFFYKWLNITVNERGSEREDDVDICDKRQQTHFFISRRVATQLVDEEMAEWIDFSHIRLLYTRKGFRHFILERDHYTCQYCQEPGNTIEHVIPQASGGITTPQNCVIACSTCNELKEDSSYEEFLEKINKLGKKTKKEG